MIKRTLALGAALILSAQWAVPAFAQDQAYPNRRINIILPIAAGGASDAIIRVMAESIAKEIKQAVIVDNRPGANGVVGATAVANSAPDGYNILVTTSGLVQNSVLRKDIPNVLPRLAPVGLVLSIPVGLAVGADLKVSNLADLVKLAKSKPDGISYATNGTGSMSHIYGETFASDAGIKMIHIPYKGEAQSIPDVLAGNLEAAFGAPGGFRSYEVSGKMKVIAVTGSHRVAAVPHVPTFGEQGFKNMAMNGWIGAFVPAGTPEPVIAKLSEIVKRAINTPAVKEKSAFYGMEPAGTSPAEFKSQIQLEADRWLELGKKLNIS